jgi:phosphohistidine phosphatase SixA
VKRGWRLAAIAFFLLAFAAPAHADEAALAALRAGGHVLIVRHGLTTPGTGDPRGFTLENCASQRNLVEEGREQARRLGRLLRENKVDVDLMISSIWCRCQETARLMDVRGFGIHPALSNLVGRGQFLEAQIRELRAIIAGWDGRGTLVLVTHGSAIFPLTGTSPREAEGFVLKPEKGSKNGFEIVGPIGPSG